MVVIGGLSGFEGGLSPLDIIFKSLKLRGILIGSRQMLEDLSNFVEAKNITPVIDRVFPFVDVVRALEYLESGAHLGKIAVKLH